MATNERSMTTITTYDAISRFNHWLVAVGIIGMLCVGLLLAFANLDKATAGWLRDIHKATGVLLLALIVWRVGWRLAQGFPESASSMPAWQEHAARFTHWALLVGIVLMPVSGLLSSLFGGHAVDVFDLFTLPAQTEIEWLDGSAGFLHTWVGRGLAALVIIHVAAALKHHYVESDSTLLRMTRGTTVTDRH